MFLCIFDFSTECISFILLSILLSINVSYFYIKICICLSIQFLFAYIEVLHNLIIQRSSNVIQRTNQVDCSANFSILSRTGIVWNNLRIQSFSICLMRTHPCWVPFQVLEINSGQTNVPFLASTGRNRKQNRQIYNMLEYIICYEENKAR